MAQRKLNVKVSADIDKSLVDLLKKLDSTKARTLKVKAVIDDKAVTAFSDKMEKAVKKTTKTKMSIDDKDLDAILKKVKDIEGDVVNVKFKADSVQLDKVSKVATELGNSFKKTHTLRVNDDGVETIGVRLNKIKDTTEQLTSKTHKVSYRAEGLNEMLNGLDNLSSKILGVAKGATMSLGKFFSSQVGELYDSQKSFETAGIELGLSGDDINSAMKTLGDFGRQSKYTVADLNRTAIALRGAGFDEEFGGFANLTTNLAKLVSLSPTAATDFSRMSKAIQDLSPDGQASKGIWNQVTRAAGGVATARMNELLRQKTGIEDINKAFRQGAVDGRMLMEIFNEVGSSAVFDKIATQSNTLRSAFDNLVESMVLGLAGTDLNSGELKPTIEGIIKVMNNLQDRSEDITKKVGRSINELVSIIGKAFSNFDIDKFVDGLGKGLTPLRKMIELATQLYSVLTNKSANTGAIIGWSVSLSAIYMTARKAVSAVSTLSKLMGSGGGGSGVLGKLLKGKKGKVDTPDIDGEGIAKSLNPLQGLNLQGLVNSLSSAALMVGISGSLKLMASAMNDIGKLKIKGNTVNNLLAIVGTLGTMSLLLGKMDGLLAKMGTSKTAIAKGALLLTGMSLSLAVMVRAFEYISNVKMDHMNTLANLGTIGLVLAGYATLSGIVGNFAPQIALGALVLTGLSISLVATTWAMEETIKNVNDIISMELPNPSDVLNQMRKLGEIIGYIAWESLWSGLKSFIGGIGGVLGTLGNMAQAMHFESIRILIGKVNEFVQVADTVPDAQTVRSAMKKVAKLLEALRGDDGILAMAESKGNDFLEFWDSIGDTLVNIIQGLELGTLMSNIRKIASFIKEVESADIPEDLSSFEKKVLSLKNVIDTLTRVTTAVTSSGRTTTYSSSGSLGGVLSSWLQGIQLDNIIESMRKISKFLDGMKSVTISDDDVTELGKKMTRLQTFMTALKNTLDSITGSGDVWSSLINAFKSIFQNSDFDAMYDSFDKIIKLAERMKKLEFDEEIAGQITKKFEAIKNMIGELQKIDFGEGGVGSIGDILSNVEEMVTNLTKIETALNELKATDHTAKIGVVMTNLTKLKVLAGHSIFTEGVISDSIVAQAQKVTTLVDNIRNIATDLERLNSIGDLSQVETNVENVAKTLKKLVSEELTVALNTLNSMSSYTGAFQKANSIIDSLVTVANKANTIPAISDAVITARIGFIENVLTELAKDGEGSILASLRKLNLLQGQFTGAETAVTSVNSIATSLSTIVDISGMGISDRIISIINALRWVGGEGGLITYITPLVGQAENFSEAEKAVEKVSDIATAINGIAIIDSEAVLGNIKNIKDAIKEITSIAIDGEAVAGLTAVVDKLKEVETAITNLSTTMTTTGTTAGNNYVQGWLTALGAKLVTKVETDMRAIEALDWTGTGTNIANKLVQAFETGIGTKLSDKVNKERLAIEAQDWYGTGTRISTALTNGFDISGILSKIQQIQTAINNLQGKTIEVTINQTTVERTVKRQHGGIIPEYHSTGGVIGRGWRQSGTDTVPAMLTAGEYVLKRSVSSYLGTQFLNALNNMNLTTAMKHLASKMGNQVVHNTTNNITQNVDNKASFLNGLNDLKGVIRA